MKREDFTKYENDNYLLEQLAMSNQNAFEFIFKTYYYKIYLYALNFNLNNIEAEDVAKESFIKIWNSSRKYDSIGHLKNTLYQIAKQICINQQIAKQRLLKREEVYQSHLQQFEDSHISKIIYSEVMAELYQAIEKLPEQARNVIIATYLEGKSNLEVAQEMNLSLQTVKNYKNRAIALLRQYVSPKTILFLISLQFFQ